MLTTIALLEQLAGQALPEVEKLAIQTLNITSQQAIFSAGQAHPYLYVIQKGHVKLVYGDRDGNEWVKAFCQAGDYFACMHALTQGNLTRFSAIAIDAVCIDRIAFAELELLALRHPAWLRVLYMGFRRFAGLKEAREQSLLMLSPTENYVALRQQQPALENAVRQQDIAQYLGITAVALSRIRRRLGLTST